MAHLTPGNSVEGGSPAHHHQAPAALSTTTSTKDSSHSKKSSISRTSSMLKKRLSLSTFLKKRRHSSDPAASGTEDEHYHSNLETLQEGTMDQPRIVRHSIDASPNSALRGEQPFPRGWQQQHTSGHSRQPSSMSMTETRSPLTLPPPQHHRQQYHAANHHHSMPPLASSPVPPHAPAAATNASATAEQDHHLETKPLPQHPLPTSHLPPPPPSPPLLPTKLAHEQPHQGEADCATPPVSYIPTPAQSSSSRGSSPLLHPATASSPSPQAVVMSAPSSTGGLSAHTTNSGSCSTTTTAVASAAASMSSLMLPPSDHGVSDLTIPEEEEEEDYATGHDDLSSYGAHSSKADEEEEERNEHHHPHDTTSSRQSSMSAATIAKRAVDDSENVHRSSSKIKRGARKIKKWLTTSKSRPQDLDKASAMAMQVTPPPLKGRNMSISSSSYSTASSSSSYSSSPLLAVGDEKIHPFQKHRRPSSQRDHDTAIPPLELNMPSKDQRRERKALSIVRPQTTNDLSDAHANVPFPVLMPEPRLRHTRSASLQTRNAATLYKGGNNGGTPRRHSSQTLRSPSTTLPTHPSSRRSLDQASEEQLWRSLQRIAHFNQRFRQKMPGPDQPCPPIRARSSSLPRSFSPALTPLDRLPASVSTYPAGGETEATVDENAAMLSLDEHRGRYCPKARSPLGHDAAVAATTTAMAASQADGASAAAVQFEQEYLQHLEQQAEQAQAEQEMKQKRQSVWVDYVDLELPESLPPSRSVVASAAARSRSTTPPSSPPPTPTTGWRGPMYWNAEGATSLQSIPSMPSSSPAHSRRNSIVSFYEDSVADESKAYQASSDDEESDDMDSSEEYDEEDEDDEEAVELHAPYPSFMTKWDMEIASEFASESKMLADDWIHPHAEDDDDDRDEEGHQEQEHDENDNRPQPPAHLRNHTNQSYLSLSSTRRSSTVAESLMSASDTMSVSGAATARLTGFLQYKTMMPNPSNMAIGKRFFWAVEAPMLPKPELTSTNTDTNTDINTKIDNTNA